MNVRKLYREIKLSQESKWQKAISYQTVRNQLAKWTKVIDIIKMKAWSWWKRESPWNKWNFKLSSRDFERAKYMFSQWMNELDISNYFRVSRSYFQYHKLWKI